MLLLRALLGRAGRVGNFSGGIGLAAARVNGGFPIRCEFQRRYRLIGGSPLVPITQSLARQLEGVLGAGFVVEAGMRIAQLVVLQVPHVELVEVDELPESERGTAGFGSSGH